MLNSILIQIRQFFTNKAVAWIIRRIPLGLLFGLLFGYIPIALVWYDVGHIPNALTRYGINGCYGTGNNGVNKRICNNFKHHFYAHLYPDVNFDERFLKKEFVLDVEAATADLQDCALRVGSMLDNYDGEILDEEKYLEAVKNVRLKWYNRLNSDQRTKHLPAALQYNLGLGFGRAVHESSENCEVFTSEEKRWDEIVSEKFDGTDGLRQAVWCVLHVENDDMPDGCQLPRQQQVAIDKRYLPLVEIQAQAQVRSGPGVNYEKGIMLEPGRQLCLVNSDDETGHIWIHLRMPAGETETVDGWIWGGGDNLPKLETVTEQSPKCEEVDDSGNTG